MATALSAEGNGRKTENQSIDPLSRTDYVLGKKKLLSVLMSGAAREEIAQAQLFQLLDLSVAAGGAAAQKAGRGTPAADAGEAMLHELFTGLLPLIGFVLLRAGLRSRYGWDEAALDSRFLAIWLHQHAGY